MTKDETAAWVFVGCCVFCVGIILGCIIHDEWTLSYLDGIQYKTIKLNYIQEYDGKLFIETGSRHSPYRHYIREYSDGSRIKFKIKENRPSVSEEDDVMCIDLPIGHDGGKLDASTNDAK